MRRLSFAAVSVLNAIARGYEYGFDIIDQTGLPSGTVYSALSRLSGTATRNPIGKTPRRRMPKSGRRAGIYYRLTANGVRALEEAIERYRELSRRVRFS